MDTAARTRSAYLALTIAGLIWGAAFYFAKIAEPYLGVGHMMVIRFIFASLGFLPILLRGVGGFSRREWGRLAVIGIIGIPIQFLVQFEGLARTTVSHASMMIGTAPVLIAVSAWFFLKERLHGIGWLAILISSAGVVLLLAPEAGAAAGKATLTGDLLVLASMAGGVTWVLLSKQLMQSHSSATVSAITTVIGTVVMMLWVIPQHGFPPLNLPPHIWGAMFILGVITTTITTLLWNYGLRYVNAGRAAIFINLEPVVGTILGVTLLGDSLGAFSLIGGGLIVVAAVLVSKAEMREE